MTDRPTLAEAQADQFWARDPDEIYGEYELRVTETTAGIYDIDLELGWLGHRETIMEQWADISHEEEPMATATTPITVPDTLDRLHLLYQVAITTAAKRRVRRWAVTYHYIELADNIHATINSIIRGVDPGLAIADLANGWRKDAPLMDTRLASLNLSWANMAEHATNPETTT